MDKKELRKQIRELKRAMTEEQIVSASQRLGELFLASDFYKNAKTIYGYLPYNQEVRTVPMLERALELGAEKDVLAAVMKNAGAEDLQKLKAALEKRLAESLPAQSQLGIDFAAEGGIESGFLI